MKALDLIKYLSGTDYLQRILQRENQLKVDSGGTRDSFPMECGLETAAKIYGLRAIKIIECPLVLGMRATGIDYLYRRLRRQE